MQSDKARQREFEMYPKYKQAYLTAFDKMLQHRKERNRQLKKDYGTSNWDTPEEVMDWWINTQKRNSSKNKQ